AHQPVQDLGRAAGRHGGGGGLDGAGGGLRRPRCADRGGRRSFGGARRRGVRGAGPGGRCPRKLAEAQGRGQGQFAPDTGAWRRARPDRRHDPGRHRRRPVGLVGGMVTPRSISILGATGSIGASTLDLIRRNRGDWRVVALTANCQALELARLAVEFSAEIAVVADEACLPDLREALAGTGIEAAGGNAALVEAASRGAEMTVAAIVGCAGLEPVIAAIEQGGCIALANKEALVSAGDILTAAVARHGATLLPTDSEHNAIFQCLSGNDLAHVRSITLTASGGPFRQWDADRLRTATPAQAVAHPNWR